MKIPRGTLLRLVKVSSVSPPHSVEESEIRDLRLSMRRYGWACRPLIGYKRGKRVQSITGSHRIRAARKVFDRIPILILKAGTVNTLKKWLHKNNRSFNWWSFYCDNPFMKFIKNMYPELHKIIRYDYDKLTSTVYPARKKGNTKYHLGKAYGV
jgi:hypothetical protein